MVVVNENILNAKEDIIAHQTNCLGVMGSGVAKYIKEKYPEVFKEYKEYCKSTNSKSLLGTVQFCKANDNKIIANLFGQHEFGRFKRQTNYEALEKCFKNLYSYAKENNLSVAIPHKIGCGNGGGDWNVVEKMINDIFHDYPVVLYKYNG